MKQLIQHLLVSNFEEIMTKSIMNCHVQGLHSIMLLEAPGKTIRMYVTTRDHQLHTNYEKADTLAFHPHHCDLTLHCIAGEFSNIRAYVQLEMLGADTIVHNRYKYNSPINTDQPVGFTLDGDDILKVRRPNKITPGNGMYLRAQDIHTIACPENSINAWLVYEGKENPKYQALAWSNNDLTFLKREGLYRKASESEVYDLLESINMM